MSKKFLNIMALFLVSLLALSMVSALDTTQVEWGTIKINGDVVDVEGGERIAVEEGEILNIKVGLQAIEDVEDVEVEAAISGYEYSDYDDLDDSAHLADLEADTTEYFNLEIAMPNKLDKDEYWLRLRVMTKSGASLDEEVRLYVKPTRHGIDIADIAFSPGNSVKAGRSLLTTVLLENYGDNTERDVKVSVAIPVLGVSATEFVDVVETDNNNVDYEDVPEMFLQVPATAQAGEYDVVVSVQYDDLRETVTKTYKLNVVANEMFQAGDKLVLAVGPESQSVQAGQTAVYAVALTNAGATSKAYVLEAVTGGDWATAALSESLVVLEPGKNQVVYVQVTPANGAVVGEHLVSLSIKSSDEVLQTVALRANVVEGGASSTSGISLRNGLEIALIVLVVLLVIIGLIVGFSRLRKDDEDEEQTYY
tara:strand:- start:633 stop:1901 length:1269 start_codon:yes stop_codon:yes gene_type:complete